MSFVTTIAASRLIDAPPRRVHAFLSELGNHWLLGGHHLRLEALGPDGRGGWISVGPALGLRRRVRTAVTRVHAPGYLGGRALVGAKTRAHVSWRIRARGPDTVVVHLTATVVAAGFLDRILLWLGGRLWLQARFHEVLDRLAAELERQDTATAGTLRSVA